jgi:hypothetical protein
LKGRQKPAVMPVTEHYSELPYQRLLSFFVVVVILTDL